MALPIHREALIRRRAAGRVRTTYKGNWNPEPFLPSIGAFADDIDNRGGGDTIIIIGEAAGAAPDSNYQELCLTPKGRVSAGK